MKTAKLLADTFDSAIAPACVERIARALAQAALTAREKAIAQVYGRIRTFIAGAFSGGLDERAATAEELLVALKAVEYVFDDQCPLGQRRPS